MSKYRKKELLEMIGTLQGTNRDIKNSSKLTDSYETLCSCQQIALEIGNDLELRGEVAKDCVHILEDYCEDIYQQSTICDETLSRKLSKKIAKQLTTLFNKVKYEIPEDKKRVIFLPYSVTMWDSLESVWLNTVSNERYETYVIPIPYYTKNSDGTLGEMHYDGDKFPSYVPVTSWKEYSLEEQKPDIIYFHNGYDDCNFVTSVHPSFYSSELKKYTNMLVYIPYFIAINGQVDRQFCIVPGVANANRVIVDSELTRKKYIEEITRFERESQTEGYYGKLEKKILALGSPKCEKLLKMKAEDIVIPDTWEQQIKNAKQEKKKVILYNTSLSALLKYGDEMIYNIENVISKFQQHDDVVLLWRPHPLMVQTLKAMKPGLLNKYSQLVENYRKSQIGIYDDSPDVERAIIISDAYYGDWSSLVEMYKTTGKPIMIQRYK